jgi:hypothetical protein
VVDSLFIALPISALTAVVVSLFTTPPDEKHLERCFGNKITETKTESAG